MYVRTMSTSALQAAVTALGAAVDELAACDVELSTRPELLNALDELQTLSCRLPSISHRLLARLQIEATPQQMGAKTWKEVLSVRWRISTGEASRRLTDAALLAPRHALIGPPLPPVLAATAAAQAAGRITAEHVAVIRKAVDRLPGFVDPATRGQFEVDLVRTALGVGPKNFSDTAELTLFLLDVPTRPGRTRTRRHRTRPQTRSIEKQAGP